MNIRKLILSGSMTAVQPISVSTHGADKQDACIVYMPIVVGENHQVVPVITGQNIKGRLRRDATRAVIEATPEKDRKLLSLDAQYLMRVGGVKSNDRETPANLKKIAQLRQRNPLLSLMGAGDPWVWGRLQVSNAVPAAGNYQIAEFNNMRLDDFKQRPDLLSELSPEDVEQFVRYTDAARERSLDDKEAKDLKVELGRLKKGPESDEKSAREAEIRELLSAHDARKKGRKSKKKDDDNAGEARPSVAQLLTVRGIAQGTELFHTMTVMTPAALEIGLLFAALDEISMMPTIGGKTNVGFGRVKARYDIVLFETGNKKTIAGEIRLEENDFTVDSDHPFVTGALEAWKAEAANLDVSRYVKGY